MRRRQSGQKDRKCQRERRVQRLGRRLRNAVATAVRLAIMYEPARKLKKRRKKVAALSVIDFLMLWQSN